MATAGEFFLPFVKKEQAGGGAYSFYFSRKKLGWTFMPGQYIRMVLPHGISDDRGTSRFLTIASSPLEKEYLMVTTRVIQSTFKKRLASLAPNDEVTFFGPIGNFTLPDNEKEPLVFLAGGMGITPFRSMLTYASVKRMGVSITLIVSFSTIGERVFYDELTKIASDHPNITVIYTTSRLEKVLKKYVANVGNPKYYVAGPPEMVETTRQLLESLRVPEEKIITESFIDY